MVLADSLHKPDAKMFAIINKETRIIEDAWIALNLEEAQKDNPGKIVVEVTLDNSPFQFGEVWDESNNEEKS